MTRYILRNRRYNLPESVLIIICRPFCLFVDSGYSWSIWKTKWTFRSYFVYYYTWRILYDEITFVYTIFLLEFIENSLSVRIRNRRYTTTC